MPSCKEVWPHCSFKKPTKRLLPLLWLWCRHTLERTFFKSLHVVVVISHSVGDLSPQPRKDVRKEHFVLITGPLVFLFCFFFMVWMNKCFSVEITHFCWKCSFLCVCLLHLESLVLVSPQTYHDRADRNGEAVCGGAAEHHRGTVCLLAFAAVHSKKLAIQADVKCTELICPYGAKSVQILSTRYIRNARAQWNEVYSMFTITPPFL